MISFELEYKCRRTILKTIIQYSLPVDGEDEAVPPAIPVCVISTKDTLVTNIQHIKYRTLGNFALDTFRAKNFRMK